MRKRVFPHPLKPCPPERTEVIYAGSSLGTRGCVDVPIAAPYNEKIQSFGRSQRVALPLKDTINLPKTAFPMKANLPQNEPKML